MSIGSGFTDFSNFVPQLLVPFDFEESWVLLNRSSFRIGKYIISLHPNRSPKDSQGRQMSHEKNPLTLHCAGCLIGILIVAHYNPHITG